MRTFRSRAVALAVLLFVVLAVPPALYAVPALGSPRGSDAPSIAAPSSAPPSATSPPGEAPSALDAPRGQAVDAVPPARRMRDFWHVFAAYAIAWLLVFGWAVSIARRLGRIEDELER